MPFAKRTFPVYDLLRVLFRHRGKAILVFLLAAATVLGVAFAWPVSYRSEGMLFVRLGRENTTLDPTATLGSQTPLGVAPSRELEINSIVAMIGSRAFAEKLYDALGPEVIWGDASPTSAPVTVVPPEAPDAADAALARAKTVRMIEKQIDVKPVLKSSVISVTCKARTPELAQNFANKLMELYVQEHARLNRPQGSHQFLEKQTAEGHAKLLAKERELRDLQNQHGILASERQREKIVEQISGIETQMIQAAAEAVAMDAQIRTLRERAAGAPATEVIGETSTADDKSVSGLRDQLYALELKQQELRASATEKYFAWPQLAQQVEAAREALQKHVPAGQSVTRGPGRVHQESQLLLLQQEPQLAASRTRAAELDQRLDKLRRQSAAFNEADGRVRQLQREVELYDANYRRLVSNLEQARIDQALDEARITSITVAQPGTFDLEAGRRRLLYAAAGLVMAAVGALAVVFLAEYLDPSIQTADEVEERFGMPVLASISRW